MSLHLRALSIVTLLILPAAFRVLPANSITVYDVTADWSDAANPNGVWSYREGTNLLPHVTTWQGLSSDFGTAQPAWARFEVGTSNIPCVFRSSAVVNIVHDWQTGDVVTHSTDPANGIGSGVSNIVWTSPLNGTVNVAGAVWMGRDIGRGNHWSLLVKSIAVTGGDISSGDAYSRAAPFNFSAGSGGPSVLNGIPVSVGDQIELQISRNSVSGDYAGIQWTVTVATVSGVGGTPPRAGLWLGTASPNPTAGIASIPFSLPEETTATIGIYDVAGRLIATPLRGAMPAGDHSVHWNGRNADGRPVRSGIYFYRLSTGYGSVTGRLTVLR